MNMSGFDMSKETLRDIEKLLMDCEKVPDDYRKVIMDILKTGKQLIFREICDTRPVEREQLLFRYHDLLTEATHVEKDQ